MATSLELALDGGTSSLRELLVFDRFPAGISTIGGYAFSNSQNGNEWPVVMLTYEERVRLV